MGVIAMNENFVLEVIADKDGIFSKDRSSVSHYKWLGHLMNLASQDCVDKAKFRQKVIDGELIRCVLADMETFISDHKDQFDQFMDLGVVPDEDWAEMMQWLYLQMSEVQMDKVTVNAIAWDISDNPANECFNVTFLVTFSN